MDNNLIPIELPKESFKKFIGDDKRNKRIFFSGKYGTGKTYFLNDFFKKYEEEYDVYHLFPARYQISANEDILELLKYDILIELIKKHPKVIGSKSKNKRFSFEVLKAFWKDKGITNRVIKLASETMGDVLSLSPNPILQMFGKIGRPLSEIAIIDKEYQDFKKEYASGDTEKLEKFLEKTESENKIATPDLITHLLQTKVNELKGIKRSVLVVDDFDRIDPEHIFRILNVLSVYISGDEENKFGFDHVIIVGDIKNIRSIFHHRYGKEAEFKGYFDKFFSIEPFQFDNKKAVIEAIPRLMNGIKCNEPKLRDAIGADGIISSFLDETLSFALDVERVNLRQLLKPTEAVFMDLSEGSYTNEPYTDGRSRVINTAIKLLIAINGDKEDALETLDTIRKSGVIRSKNNSKWLYRELPGTMLRSLIDLPVNQNTNWQGYKLKADEDGKIYPVDNNNPSKEYFYDVLIEYIKRERYKHVRELG
jgi:hypothetical protein